MGNGAAVDVAEELPDVSVGAAVAEEGVVVQDDSLPTHAYGHLLSNEFKQTHEALADALHIVVPQNEIFAAGEDAENVVPKPGTAVCEIAQVELDAIFWHRVPPAADEFRVHLLGVAERPIAETDDVFVPEVGVGREPYLIW